MIEINIVEEFYIFLTSFNTGLIAGFTYDLYRTFRHFSKPNKILSILEDFIFWVLVSFIFFRFLVRSTDGIIRGFVFLGFGIGSIFYLKVVSKYNFSLLIYIFRLILNGISEIMKIILYPFRNIIQFTKGRVGKSSQLVRESFKEMKNYMKIISGKK